MASAAISGRLPHTAYTREARKGSTHRGERQGQSRPGDDQQLRQAKDGYGPFTGCAIGDTAAALVIRVGYVPNALLRTGHTEALGAALIGTLDPQTSRRLVPNS